MVTRDCINYRLLYFTAEPCPTFRADVHVLFGKVLPEFGIYSDIVAGKETGTDANDHIWEGGEAYLCDMNSGTTKNHIKIFLHRLKFLFKADSERYHAIQVRDLPILAVIGLFVAKLKGINFFYWMSYPIPEGKIILARDRGLSEGLIKFLFPLVTGWIGWLLLYYIVLPRVDHAFVQSDRMKSDLINLGIPPEKMTPVPMGVDIAALQNIQMSSITNEKLLGKRIIVYLGTLNRTRKIEILFDMLAIVKMKFPNVLLLLVGSTDDRTHHRWLEKKAKEAGVSDHILWTGWLPAIEGWGYVRAAEVGLSPFPRGYLLDSASPTKVPEYLALGIPVVCNDNPDQQEIICQSGAGICVPYTATDFAKAVIQLLNLDNNKRNEMIEKGKSYILKAREYSIIGSAVAQSYNRLRKR